MTDALKTLADYPYVVVRIECGLCGRRGRYRLARLAERFGADITLEDLLDQIAGRRCRYPRPSPPPPNLPGGGLRLVASKPDAA